ncbi:MAG: S-layer homology domain-containing protein [Clostridiales Family XIII bacterium]|jgi:hypothetical protein|nr:S-layer homology domain-containing protein [Clostridiales Family XIII bacterium]
MKKSILKLTAAALACLLAGAASAAVYAAPVPPDVTGKSYERAVSILAAKDIVTGDVDGQFYPDANLTRAQFCTIVVKAMQAPEATVNGTPSQAVKKSGFPDLDGYGWAEGYIAYAVEKGVVTGYPDGSFKPGSNVSMSELITMTLRAAGFSDASLGGVWPENYVAKAGDLGALAGITAPLPESATKWMAAQLVCNVLDRIEAANPPAKEPADVTETPEQPPENGGFVYVNNGAFDGDITTFAGKDLASDVQVYAYGLKADYKNDMKLSEDNADFLSETVYKYKSVETPAWYELQGNAVTKIILPHDVGFSGRAYSVLNGIVQMSDGEDNMVAGFVTYSAGRKITWAATAGLGAENIPSGKNLYDGGQLFELQLRNGKVTNVASVDSTDGAFNPPPRGGTVTELTPGKFTEVTAKTGTVVSMGDDVYEIRSNASVYVLEDGEYSVGTASSVRLKSMIRLYDVSDDKNNAADVVIIEN